MPETIVRIRILLAQQLQAIRPGMQSMSGAEWEEYQAREELIAALIASLSDRRSNKAACY